MKFGPVAQLVRAPPCHGGGRGFESHPGRLKRTLRDNCKVAVFYEFRKLVCEANLLLGS